MKQTDPQYKLRLPQDLKDQIEAAAKQSGRSMNAEIIARLKETFGDRPTRAEFSEAHERAHQLLAEPWSKEAIERFQKLATAAGEAAATRVLQAQGLNALKIGEPSLVQTPPPPKAKK